MKQCCNLIYQDTDTYCQSCGKMLQERFMGIDAGNSKTDQEKMNRALKSMEIKE
jgi:hypothetical protein